MALQKASGHEEELHRRRKMLDVILPPGIKLNSADVQQLLVSKEELPPEQQKKRSPSLDQEDTNPPHIKEEQEELCIIQDQKQICGQEETGTTKIPFISVYVKSEDDDEEPQSSQLHQRQTEKSETGADVEDCGGAEAARKSNPGRPRTEVKTEDSSEPETDDSDDWNETSGHQPGLNIKEKRPKTKKSHSCSVCSKIFSNKSNLTAHMFVHTGEKPFGCPECDKRFNFKGNLTKHMIIHKGEKPFSCSECGKSFFQKGNLTAHMLVHLKENPFSCPVCQKRFNQKGNLTKHILGHKGERPYSCSVCSLSFNRKEYLTKHMMVHTEEEPFSCNFCNKNFKYKSSLLTHIRIHTGEKPYICPVCCKTFNQKGTLTSHMLVHQEKEKETLSCTQCDRRFNRKSTLTTHMRTHTGEKPYLCPKCHERFSWFNQFKSHSCVGGFDSGLHRSQTVGNREAEMGTDGDPESNSDSERHFHPGTLVETDDSELESEDCDED